MTSNQLSLTVIAGELSRARFARSLPVLAIRSSVVNPENPL
jgi:hypothetical protein